jgi:hypothetical protein
MRNEGLIDLPSAEPSEWSPDSEMDIEESAEDPIWNPDRTSWDEARADEDGAMAERLDRHPLLSAATDLQVRVYGLLGAGDQAQGSHVSVLLSGLADLTGGLAQALLEPRSEIFEGVHRGWSLAQFKRALRGAAFAQGALFPLQAEGRISKADLEGLRETLTQISDAVHDELARVRRERRA